MPRKPPVLDYVLIEKLANLGCPDFEIAYAIGYTPQHFSTLKKKDKLLREAIDRGSNGVKISVRRAQLRKAMPSDKFMANPDDPDAYSGNMGGLIWLGKQYLHQSDHLKIGGDGGDPININLKTVADLVRDVGEGKGSKPTKK